MAAPKEQGLLDGLGKNFGVTPACGAQDSTSQHEELDSRPSWRSCNNVAVIGTLSLGQRAFSGSATVFSKRSYSKCLIAFVCDFQKEEAMTRYGRAAGKAVKSALQRKKKGTLRFPQNCNMKSFY